MRHSSALLALAALAATTATSFASVINITITTKTPYAGTGAAPDTGTVWNAAVPVAASASATNLKYSDGTTAVPTISFSASGGVGSFSQDGGPDATGNELLDNAIYTKLTPEDHPTETFVISGLSPGSNYDLFLYGTAGKAAGNQGATFAINPANGVFATQQTTGVPQPVGGPYDSSDIPATDNGQVFVEFDGVVADGSGDITGTANPNTLNANVGIFNGLQLEFLPEPASLGTLGVGALALMRRRRSASH